MTNVPNEDTPPYIDLLIDPLKKKKRIFFVNNLLQQNLEVQIEVSGGYQESQQNPLAQQDVSRGQEFRGASPINL